MSTPLLPCPWPHCPGSAHIEREETSFSGDKVVGVDEDNGPIYYVECDLCGCRGPLASWAMDAAELWNTRAPSPVSEEEVADIRRACQWPTGFFSVRDMPGDHEPTYLVLPDGALVSVSYHGDPAVNPAQCEFIAKACNAALSTSLPAARGVVSEEMVERALSAFLGIDWPGAFNDNEIGHYRIDMRDALSAALSQGGGGEALPPFLLEMGERIRTQDNRCTAHAMFCVQRLVRIDGIDESLGMPMEYRYADDGDALPLEFNEAIEEAMASGASKVELGGELYQLDKIKGYGFVDRWETVMVSMTEQGCIDYIKANGHNLEKYGHPPRIFVESFHRCQEMIQLREWLMELPAPANRHDEKGGG